MIISVILNLNLKLLRASLFHSYKLLQKTDVSIADCFFEKIAPRQCSYVSWSNILICKRHYICMITFYKHVDVTFFVSGFLSVHGCSLFGIPMKISTITFLKDIVTYILIWWVIYICNYISDQHWSLHALLHLNALFWATPNVTTIMTLSLLCKSFQVQSSI